MSSTGYNLVHPADPDGEASYTFTCGKIDAGIAVLIGSHAHLIEFPSLLLPPGCEPGSIVSITCARDHAAEKAQADSFWELQTKIINQFGVEYPKPPNLRLRSVTQTSVTLEWDKLELAQCKLICLSIWKNGQRLGTLPNPSNNTSTKLSGLDLGTEYTFHLVMKTSGGTFNSQKITVKTHSLNDTSGINVCFGIVLPEELHQKAKEALEQLEGRWSDKIQIDTTHFVCTMAYHPQHAQSKNSQPNNFPSLSYQRALQLSIPVVQPSWLLACLHERKMVPIAAHYLGVQPPPLSSSPSTASSSSGVGRPRSASKVVVSSSSSFSPQSVGMDSSPSSNAGKNDQRHERTMSAPENSSILVGTGGRLPDQAERPTGHSLEAIAESSKDNEPSHQRLEEIDGLENVDLKSAALHEDTRRLSLNGMNETDSEKTFKLGPTSAQSSSIDQPNLPTPSTVSNLSDILKENVDSPPDNEGSNSNLPSISSNSQTVKPVSDRSETLIVNDSKVNQEASKSAVGSSMAAGLTNSTTNTFSTKTQTNNSVGLNSGDRMIDDDGDDDPFSAASPTMSNPSPSIDDTDFAHRLRLNNQQIPSDLFLAPDSSSPMFSSATLKNQFIADDPSSPKTIKTKEEINRSSQPEDKIDQSMPPASFFAPSTSILNPTSFSPATKENSTDVFEDVPHASSSEAGEEATDEKNEKLTDDNIENDGIKNPKSGPGSGDTFFSTAESVHLPSQNPIIKNLEPSNNNNSDLVDHDDNERMDLVDI